MSTVLILLTSIVLATAGQVLLKAGMNEVGVIDGLTLRHMLTLARGAATTWQVVAGLASFGLSATAWLITLSRIPLSSAYPVVSLSYVLILLFSTIILGERPSLLTWSGAILIVIGISFVGLGQR